MPNVHLVLADISIDLLCFCSVLCMLCLCARLFICALWSPAGKGLTSWLSFVVSTVKLTLSHWYMGQVWYLIVSIPDLCTFTYFDKLQRIYVPFKVYKLSKIMTVLNEIFFKNTFL